MPPIRLATASPATAPTTSQTLSDISTLASRASASGADLLLLPEAYLGAGYPRGASFGSKIGSRAPEGRDEFLAYFNAAVDLGDTVGDAGAGGGDRWVKKQLPAQHAAGAKVERGDGSREELEKIAAQTGVFLVVGCIERAGGSLYCSVVYVCPKLGMIGKRRKVMPTATERLIWAQGSPATLRAVSTTIKGVRINLAAAICWESYMPLLRQSLYAQNINLYLAPTADGRDTWLPLMRTVACEGRCFVVSSNMAARPLTTAASTSTSATTAAAAVDNDSGIEDAPDAQIYPTRARRNSCLTEDGNEIALPGTSNGTSANGANKTATKATSSSKPALESKDWVSRGGSSIVGPFGDVLAGPQWEDDEGIIYADVDFEDCIRGRLDIDVGGSYSRNDSFKFSVEGLDLDPLPY
ncbi:carbon-nitrogen hydrolase [Colletotrichum scovillei]|uniref:Nitrilase n=1 Tax=Colletotrichum scovillei TaxID=1209932 RepID=A0A9P7RB67_9PEZI|nr:carbon-nitrogen hydrolase [Colletotrichum scovillei]KAF4775970.1 carbon-nitrogen hydrolase [Colletotrichum scovillei]KAG7053322.1 nitrilase [Colletotrichum scovillei]KAG7071615.1 nitrilase [Colletotrichum scovillei]KAG7079897.1 nitrilase [Colletotrichum scovillei]